MSPGALRARRIAGLVLVVVAFALLLAGVRPLYAGAALLLGLVVLPGRVRFDPRLGDRDRSP